jgi:hypothetical protein
VTVTLDNVPVGMPRQLGYERGTHSLALSVRIALQGKLDKPPS